MRESTLNFNWFGSLLITSPHNCVCRIQRRPPPAAVVGPANRPNRTHKRRWTQRRVIRAAACPRKWSGVDVNALRRQSKAKSAKQLHFILLLLLLLLYFFVAISRYLRLLSVQFLASINKWRVEPKKNWEWFFFCLFCYFSIGKLVFVLLHFLLLLFLRFALHIFLQVSYAVVVVVDIFVVVAIYFQMSNGVEGGPVCIYRHRYLCMIYIESCFLMLPNKWLGQRTWLRLFIRSCLRAGLWQWYSIFLRCENSLWVDKPVKRKYHIYIFKNQLNLK